jgi:transposase
MSWRRGQAYSQDLQDRAGEHRAGAQRSHTPAKLAGYDEALRQRVRLMPDATLAELVEWARAELGVSVSLKTMWSRLRRLALTLKESRSSPPKGLDGERPQRGTSVAFSSSSVCCSTPALSRPSCRAKAISVP